MTRMILAALAAFSLFLSPAAAAPQPGALETYKDWVIGCDNGGRCTAASLNPEKAVMTGEFAEITILRDAGPAAQPTVGLHFYDEIKGQVQMVIDGRIIASATISGGTAIQGPRASALAIAMAQGRHMEVRQNGKAVARVSLDGSAAALRYMDARQGRAGTVTALVAAGPLRAAAVKPALALPRIKRSAVPTDAKTAPLTAAERKQAEKLTGCDAEFNVNQKPELYPLDRNRTLVMLPCGAGAYNFSSAALIVTGKVGKREFTAPIFDLQPGWGMKEDGYPMLVNYGLDAARSTLSSYTRGRGLGDCGGAETYVWDGSQFRLVEARSMGECRGAMKWITTWRANVTES